MEQRDLGRTGMRVSVLCLGTMTWGQQNTEAEGHEQMDCAVERGINFFDTAELYPIPPKPGTQGRTEEVIGTWFKARGNREKIILATKVIGRSRMTWLREDNSAGRITRAQVMEAVDKSLKRLQTDYIDLYQLHWPDRPVPIFGDLEFKDVSVETVAIEEQMETLGDLVKSGKIRAFGVSNETPWGVAAFLKIADQRGLPRVASVQNAYNLLNRVYQIGLSEFAPREDVGLLAYSPLAQGYLTGKYIGGARPANSRLALFGDRIGRYAKVNAAEAIEAYVAIANKHGFDPAQMALQFVTQQPFVTASIIGATTIDQLKANIDSVNITLGEEVLSDIDAVHRRYPNPAP